MQEVLFEEIRAEHLQDVLEIYSYYVLNTTATFHDCALTADDMKHIVFFDNPKYKTFVINKDQTICGYVILHQYRPRGAYDSSAEVTVYLKPESIGKGIGNLAIQYIEEYARTIGIHVLVSAICGENTKSINLFERNGYFKCAHYKEIGKKFGQFLDVVEYQKILD